MVRRYFVSTSLAACVMAALLLLTGQSAFAQEDDVNALFQRGLSEFKQGYYGYTTNVPGHPHGAMYYFERVKRIVGGKPDAGERAALATLMLREAGYGTAIRMSQMSHTDDRVQSEMRGFGHWLMSTASEPNVDRDTNREAINRTLLRAMRDPNAEERLKNMETIRIRFGEFAVPEIQRQYLHCGNEELMGRAMMLLNMIGRNAVMPLIEIMRHFEDTARADGGRAGELDRLHAAHVLGDLGDPRAVPILMERLQDKNERPNVRAECKLALEKILGPINTTGDAQIANAEAYYYSMALKYYHQLPELIYGRTDSFVVWYWVFNNIDNPREGGYLDYDERIPIWAYMDIQAEQSCLDALRLKPDYQEAWDLLIDVNLRQFLEARARWNYATDAERERFAGLFERAHRGAVLGAPAGQLAIYRAIRRALIDRLPEVAIAAIEKLKEVGDRRFVPKSSDYDRTTGTINSPGAPLIEALTYDDKRVRYAAAQALFTLNNNRIKYRGDGGQLQEFDGFFAIESARDVLIQGLGESLQRTILVITSNLDLKNDMRQKLAQLGYYVYFADSPTEGIDRALNFPSDDLILLDAKIAGTPIRTMMTRRDEFRGREVERVETIFDVLSDDFRTADIPIVLMASPRIDSPEDLRDRFRDAFDKNQVKGVLPLQDDGNSIDPLVADLGTFRQVWADKTNDSKDRANQIAINCAAAIREWDPDRVPPNSTFFRPVIRALVARVGDPRKNTDVKVAMLKTLEQFCQAKDDGIYPVSFWNDDVIPNVLLVLTSEPEVDEPIVKYWACKVLSAIYLNRLQGAKWTPEDFDPASVTLQARDPNQNPYWALFDLLDWNPPVGQPDDDDADMQTWEKQWHEDVKAVREAAGEVLGSVNGMTDIERRYIYMHKRINLPRPNHYDPRGENR